MTSGKREVCTGCGELGEFIVGAYFQCLSCDSPSPPEPTFEPVRCLHVFEHYQVYGLRSGIWCIACGDWLRAF